MGQIAIGAGEVFICAGVESMSRVPMVRLQPAAQPRPRQEEPAPISSMGETAENVATRYQIGRGQQEALRSKARPSAGAARTAGKFADEIVPIETKQGMVE